MNLISYIGVKVKIILENGFYFIGDVLAADESSLDLLDFKGNRVSLSKSAILSIREVSHGN